MNQEALKVLLRIAKFKRCLFYKEKT